MDLAGTINCEMNAAKWEALIAEHDELSPVKKITVVNPFTQEIVHVGNPGECVSVTIADAEAGAMRWCEKGSGIDVHGNPDDLGELIASICKACSGTFAPAG